MSDNTKNSIVLTFIDMTIKKGIDKVTVKDLMEQCGISRQTFYYHFNDLMDVLEYSITRQLDCAIVSSKNEPSIEDSLKTFVNIILEERNLFHQLLLSKNYKYIEKMFIDAVKAYLKVLLGHTSNTYILNYLDLEKTLDFYSFAVVGYIIKYGDYDKPNADELASQLYKLLKHPFVNITDEKSQKQYIFCHYHKNVKTDIAM